LTPVTISNVLLAWYESYPFSPFILPRNCCFHDLLLALYLGSSSKCWILSEPVLHLHNPPSDFVQSLKGAMRREKRSSSHHGICSTQLIIPSLLQTLSELPMILLIQTT
jgi:hypothetical protein